MHAAPALATLEALYQAMPPVAALQLRVAGFDGDRLQLQAPLDAHVNDKGCAFGGSLASLMTLAGWGLVSLHLQQAGVAAEIYVAESHVDYRAPLFADLRAVAGLDPGASWADFDATLQARGRASVRIAAHVPLPDGGIAAESSARFVAVATRYDPP